LFYIIILVNDSRSSCSRITLFNESSRINIDVCCDKSSTQLKTLRLSSTFYAHRAPVKLSSTTLIGLQSTNPARVPRSAQRDWSLTVTWMTAPTDLWRTAGLTCIGQRTVTSVVFQTAQWPYKRDVDLGTRMKQGVNDESK
jgi:hypothetical protein